MIAGTAQCSFSKTENCLENTISRPRASAANWADAARAAACLLGLGRVPQTSSASGFARCFSSSCTLPVQDPHMELLETK